MSNKNDALGDRMKQYEAVPKGFLTRRLPAIIRLDGSHFHTVTRGFARPFDDVLTASMQQTMKYLCESIQGCVLGYTQSDEISLVLVDYKKLDTEPWFGYNIQKCVSTSAAMASAAFAKFFQKNANVYVKATQCISMGENQEGNIVYITPDSEFRSKAYAKALSGIPTFDSRIFTLPKEEVCNYILWRQNDCIRNSIEALGQAHFSANQLHKKSQYDILNMLYADKDIDWNDLPTHLKRGSCCIKTEIPGEKHPKWKIDTEIPIFKKEDRKYVDDLIYVGE